MKLCNEDFLKNGCKVKITISGEEGFIVGFAEYIELPKQFYVSYKAADGRAVKDWFYGSELEAVISETKVIINKKLIR